MPSQLRRIAVGKLLETIFAARYVQPSFGPITYYSACSLAGTVSRSFLRTFDAEPRFVSLVSLVVFVGFQLPAHQSIDLYTVALSKS